MKNSMLKRRITRLVIPACTALLFAVAQVSCSDDLLTGTPEYLGESIYGELERRGNFTETLKLINAQDDDDYATMLRRTGSKTLFVADDAAWAEFYKNNSWGVKSIDEMTTAQKRMLFKASMINSAYLLELLGNMQSKNANEPPVEGSCMRRESSMSYLDSLPLVSTYPPPNPARVDSVGNVTDYWVGVRNREHIYLLQDNTDVPMIHLMPKFMKNSNITDADVAFLTNGKVTSNDFAFVNGQMVREDDNANNILWQDVVCQNGYIHVLEGVPTPLDNLANLIAKNPQFSIYNRLLDRFSYPHYLGIFENSVAGKDSVFVKRYFNSHGQNGFNTMDDHTPVQNLLPYDPGWNRYALQSASNASYQGDAAVMLVPTDEAMKDYLQHDGADLNELYAEAGPGETAWDNAPDEVVLPLLENTMFTSFKAAIPSQVGSLSNSAGENLKASTDDIEQVLWGCNGIIYQTKKVYVAPEYVSVYYPVILRANKDLSYVYTVVNNDRQVVGGEGFRAYLTSMGSKYSFIIPTNTALQTYYDPVSRFRKLNNKPTAVAYKFYVNDGGCIAATPYDVDWDNLDEKGRGIISSEVSKNSVTAMASFNKGSRDKYDAFNHFKDIINSSLCTSLFTPGRKFYLAKNGSPVIVEWNGSEVVGVAGSFQYERGYYIPVSGTVDKTATGNGCSYVVDEEPLMSTFTSPYSAIRNDAEGRFQNFSSLLEQTNILLTGKDATNSYATQDKAFKNLDNYHYTIYVPTNESIQELMDSHLLPTDADFEALDNCIAGINPETDIDNYNYLQTQLQAMRDVVANFVNYHIQDNSVFIDGEAYSDKTFETACLDTLSNRFAKVRVTYDPETRELIVKDNCVDAANPPAKVNNEVCNILTRQYYFAGHENGKAPNLATTKASEEAGQIYSSSFAVIHQIDKPLRSSATCYYDPAEYQKVMDIIATYSTSNTKKKSKR